MEQKYLILDFGKVLAYPVTGHWFITPLLNKIVENGEINREELLEKIDEYSYMVGRKLETLDEEYKMFYDFYENVLSNINFPNYSKEIVEKIANNITYGSDKYKMYDAVKGELKKLKDKYTLLLLSDNWPCCNRLMKEYKIYDYFDKIYISSVYGVTKGERVFFDYPINDYNIKQGEAIFVDDNEKLLDIAEEKGLYVRLMDRENEVTNSKHKIIHNLYEI